LITCQYNMKNWDVLLGGCYAGQLNLYDLRQSCSPVGRTAVEASHYDPVYDVSWLGGKTGTECVSVASDGQLLFWDTRKLTEWADQCILTDGSRDEPRKTVGGTALEWMMEAGATKFLLGTEHGLPMLVNRRAKKAPEIGTWFGHEDRGGYGRHFGPVCCVRRNPTNPKFFLSVGDWCAKVWMEELKGPMLQTPSYPAFLTAAEWSPTRAGLFFLTRGDGRLDLWDYFYRMNEVSMSVKVQDCALTSMRINPAFTGGGGGSLLAVGSTNGMITLMQLCDGLVQPGPNEKNLIGQMFDRENKREKNLEAIKKQAAGAKGKETAEKAAVAIDQEQYQAREKAFFADVGMTGDDLGTTLGGVQAGG